MLSVKLFTIGLCWLQMTVLSGKDHCLHKQTWSNAADCCHRRGDNNSLPEINSVHALQRVTNDMILANKSQIWIDMYRRTLLSWTWLHGIKSNLLDQKESGCAAIQEVGNVTAEKCSRLLGQLCQVGDCTDCSDLGHFLMSCHATGGKCFVYLCEGLSWEMSRTHCLKHGWDLAVTSDENLLEIMNAKSPCQMYWIGLRREEWITGKSNSGYENIPSVSLWRSGEPSDRGDCAVMYQDTDHPKWKAENCQTAHDFICVKQEVQSTVSEVFSKRSTVTAMVTREKKNNGSLIGIHVIIAVVVSVVFISIGVIAFKVYKKWTRSQQERRASQDSYEEIPMLSVDSGAKSRLQQLIAKELLRKHRKIDIWSFDQNNNWVQIDEIYTDVQWVRQGSRTKAEKYIDMFDKDTDNLRPERIIVFGDAGSGKTTLTKRIVVDWSRVIMTETEENPNEIEPRVKSGLQEFRYIIPIFMRDIKKGQCLLDILREQLRIDKKNAARLLADLRKFPKESLLILDGYDEFIEERCVDLVNIVQREFFVGVNIIVTSRSFGVKSSKLKGRKWDVTVHIHGLSPKSIDQYIDKFAYRRDMQKTSAKDLKENVKKFEDLSEMSKCPAILLLICTLWHKSKNIGHTYTSFYKGFVKFMCFRYWGKYFPDKLDMSGEDIFRHFKTELLQIGKIAFKGLEKETLQTVFSYDELGNEVQETTSTWRLGFFKLESGSTDMFSFHHRTVQEFFTALHIVHSVEKNEIKPLGSLIKSNDRLRDSKIILKFVKGLGGKACGSLVKKALEGFCKEDQREITSFHLSFLDEQDSVSDMTLPECLHIDIDETHKTKSYITYLSLPATSLTELKIGTPNLNFLSYLEHLTAPNLKSLEVHKCDSSSFATDELHPEGLERILVSLNVREILFAGFEKEDSALMERLLFNIDELDKLKTLNFHNCHFQENVYSQIARNLPNLSQLTSFSLRQCKILGDQLEEMCMQLKSLKNLKILDFCLIEASSKVQRMIADALHHLSKLTNLLVCNFTGRDSDGSLHLVDAVGKLKHLQLVHLGRFSLGDPGLEALSANLPNLKTLQEVSIHSCSCNDTEVWANFIQALSQIPELTALDLSQNKVGQAALLSVNNVLTKLKKLHTLKLSDCGISAEDDLLRILSGVSTSPSVKYLSLSLNGLEGNLMKITDQSISVARLAELDIRDNGLDQILKDKIFRIMSRNVPDLKIIL